jgi:competence protein ComEA
MERLPFTRRQLLVAALLAGITLLVAGRFLASAGTPSAATPVPSAVRPAAAAAAAPAAPRLVVDVVGAVRRPGLYRLPPGARIADAVVRAGGFRRAADKEAINLAAPLADGEQVVVPRRISGSSGSTAHAATGPGAAPGAGAAATGPVHLSTATLEQLDALPGVGPVTAQKILDYRTEHGAFRSVDELDAVPGIGPARLDQLRDLVAP